MNQRKINVIDSIMGSGKTSYFINQMNEHKEKSYIYITPFLDECKRVRENTESDFYEPQQHGRGKLDSFNQLLGGGCNIVSTHSLFSMITQETKDLIKQGRYTLILDEVMNVVEPYDELRSGDLPLLLKEQFISIDKDTKYVIWNEDKQYPDSTYEKVMRLAQNKGLVCINNTLLLWHFPVDVFYLFEEVYILTYMFDGSIMKSYFDFHGIDYLRKSVKQEKSGYCLTNYYPEDELREQYSELINICDNNRLNSIGQKYYALSSTWHKGAKGRGDLDRMKKNLTNYFTNIVKSKSNTIMWTSLKEYRHALSGQGFTYAKPKKDIPENPSREDENKAFCFVPCNCRATNIYGERFNLAYTINVFAQPFIKEFFRLRDIEIDEEKYALSEMVQWIWRSRIRNDQPINIYIPSSRMRNLLIDWINKADIDNGFMKDAS